MRRQSVPNPPHLSPLASGPDRIRARIAESMDDAPAMLSYREAARYAGISVRTVHRLVRDGHLRPVKLSPGARGRVRIPRAELIDALARMVRP